MTLSHRRRHQIRDCHARRAHFGCSPCSFFCRAWHRRGRVAPDPGSPRTTGGADGNCCPCGHIGRGRALAQLQRTNVGHDAPAIARRNLRSIIRHGPEAVGHHIEKISQWRFLQALRVIRRRLAEAALDDHSVAIPNSRVTRRAIDIEALLPARQHVFCNRERHVIAGILAHLPGIEIRVFVKLSARNRALDRISRRTQIANKNRSWPAA